MLWVVKISDGAAVRTCIHGCALGFWPDWWASESVCEEPFERCSRQSGRPWGALHCSHVLDWRFDLNVVRLQPAPLEAAARRKAGRSRRAATLAGGAFPSFCCFGRAPCAGAERGVWVALLRALNVKSVGASGGALRGWGVGKMVMRRNDACHLTGTPLRGESA
ncbi:unnamed protein product [Ostreobium quekettii]|uniref:Uncharacterized protein n=1 Tax=Ostreobium quekettii TaxID=121088 RepID=A0A8S1J136_9CHLO|nr:unnamed protein product [Ostreobium quekettii]